jgi:hypothetical protein
MSQVGHVSSAFAKLVADAVPSVTADKLPPEASPFDPNWLDGADADAGRKTPLIGPEIGPEVSNRSESRVSRHHLSAEELLQIRSFSSMGAGGFEPPTSRV